MLLPERGKEPYVGDLAGADCGSCASRRSCRLMLPSCPPCAAGHCSWALHNVSCRCSRAVSMPQAIVTHKLGHMRHWHTLLAVSLLVVTGWRAASYPSQYSSSACGCVSAQHDVEGPRALAPTSPCTYHPAITGTRQTIAGPLTSGGARLISSRSTHHPSRTALMRAPSTKLKARPPSAAFTACSAAASCRLKSCHPALQAGVQHCKAVHPAD